MTKPRFFALVCTIDWCWSLNISSPTSGASPQIATSFTLPNRSKLDNATWHSRDILGESPEEIIKKLRKDKEFPKEQLDKAEKILKRRNITKRTGGSSGMLPIEKNKKLSRCK